MMYVSQIIMLYTFNLCSAVCQLYLSKTRRKKRIDDHFIDVSERHNEHVQWENLGEPSTNH